nr:hypothetical protein CFP56_22963 [Quercus suber]
MVVVPGFYEIRKKSFAGTSRATEVSSDSSDRPVHSTPPLIVPVQPLDGTDSRDGMQAHSGSRTRDESQLVEGAESSHALRGSAETQVHSICPLPQAVQGEFPENQINEINRGLTCFDTNDGDTPTNAGLDIVIPLGQKLRSDLVPYVTPCDTNENCPYISNNSLAASSDVSDSGSLPGSGKVVSTKRRRVVRTVSDFVISNSAGGAPIKRTSEGNALEGLPRKRRVVSRQEKNGDLLMGEAGVQLR